MPRNLILIANASRAKILESDRAMHDVRVIEEFDHPEGRARAGELLQDRAGRLHKNGATRSAYEPHSTPHEVELDAFARTLARRLGEHCREWPTLPVILLAPPAMLGRLRASLDESVRRQVLLEMAHDYTGTPPKDLLEILRAQQTV